MLCYRGYYMTKNRCVCMDLKKVSFELRETKRRLLLESFLDNSIHKWKCKNTFIHSNIHKYTYLNIYYEYVSNYSRIRDQNVLKRDLPKKQVLENWGVHLPNTSRIMLIYLFLLKLLQHGNILDPTSSVRNEHTISRKNQLISVVKSSHDAAYDGPPAMSSVGSTAKPLSVSLIQSANYPSSQTVSQQEVRKPIY